MSIDPSSPQVEVEIYDDSSAPCFLSTFGAAPSNASYDGRYYAQVGGYYQYNAYFEVPGSNNIQELAYADFNWYKTAEVASGEAFTGAASAECPVLGQINNNDWNYDGQPASQPTFASSMNLYTGSWQNWTTSVAQTSVLPSDPYEVQQVSNFSAGDYTEWKVGGPF